MNIKEFCEHLYFISWIYDSVAETGQKSDGSNSDFSGWSKNSLNDSTIIRKVIDYIIKTKGW